MEAKIKFLDTEITVVSCREKRISDRYYLEIIASEKDTTYDELAKLKNNKSGIIEYYEKPVDGDWVLVMKYEDFNGGYAASYENELYKSRVYKLDPYAKQVIQNTANIEYISIIEDIPINEV